MFGVGGFRNYLRKSLSDPFKTINNYVNKIRKRGVLKTFKGGLDNLERKIRETKFKKSFRSLAELLNGLDVEWYITSGLCTKAYVDQVDQWMISTWSLNRKI